ncbi:MAG: nuclear transport factor 2 family protein [Chloroflexota bacterium]|nr:nuclear transport factor 2 family protein [Chloroflexota bacterium]
MESLMHGDGQDVLERYKRAWEGRDVDAVMELYAADAEHRDDPFREPYQGANAIRAMWNDIAANEANVEFDAERIWISGRTVLAAWHAAYTDATSGDRVRMRGFATFELDAAGLIQRLREWPISKVVGRDSTYAPLRRPEGGG